MVDPDGGFFEALSASGEANMAAAKTLLNQARLTYVFSHASVLGGDKRMRLAADHGFDFLKRAGRAANSVEGWPRSSGNHGDIADASRDTYDHAFVIFAMAWYYRASQVPEALQLAEQAFSFLERHLADRVGSGFFEEYPATGKLPRRQNPHMHLLEAVLAMHSATGDALWINRATALVLLFKTVFFDAQTASLAEFFDAGWRPAGAAAGLLREPGHQFEWVWLLAQTIKQSGSAQAQAQSELEPYAEKLFAFGTRYGLDPSGPLKGVVFDAVAADGSPLATSKLLWPQTEYIKACVARFETTRDASYKQQAFGHFDLMRKYFFRADDANWVNHVARGGEPLVTETPSRVLYHLFLAASELIRIAES